MWRAFLIFILLLPRPVYAQVALPDLEVDHDLVLSGRVTLYRTITILAGATLTISRETEVQFLPGGGIFGSGNLVVAGEEAAPVVLDGSTWQGIRVSGTVHLSWLLVTGASGPFNFNGKTTQLDHVTVRDAPDSRFVFQPGGGGNVTLSYFTVSWSTVNSANGVFDLAFNGPIGVIYILNLRVPRKTILGTATIVHVTGGYIGMSMIGAKTADGCFLAADFFLRQSAEFRPDPSCHPKEPSLLFVPGYGASLNYPFLLNPTPVGPIHTGWSLVPYFTRSYDSFLHAAQSRGIKTDIAYYDWRQSLNTIVSQYLIPAIDALKRRDGVDQVYLVAHSFGGLVARQYIQSPLYRGDVAGFVEMGVPNRGSVKSYGAWEGGAFPPDWHIIAALVHYYQHVESSFVSSDLQALRSFIPSGGELLPIDPVLTRFEGGYAETLSVLRNYTLYGLSTDVRLVADRVPLAFTVTGTGEVTNDGLVVGPQHPGSLAWPDGEVQRVDSRSPGDGTVSYASSLLPNMSDVVVRAAHMDIPAVAASYVLDRLYPLRVSALPTPMPSQSILWFNFDCPISVVVTTPSGAIVNSTPRLDDTAAVYSDPSLLWMIFPKENGTYYLNVTALADTSVRWWQGSDTVHTFALQKGAVKQLTYRSDVSVVAPTATPSVTPSPPLGTVEIPNDPHTPNVSLAWPAVSNFTLQARGQGEQPSLVWSRVLAAQAVPVPTQHKKEPPHLTYLLMAAPLILRPRKKGGRLPHAHHPP